MEQILLRPIGAVRSEVKRSKEDYWGDVVSVIDPDAGQSADSFIQSQAPELIRQIGKNPNVISHRDAAGRLLR